MMEYNRYGDITKFVTDSSKLKIENGCEVHSAGKRTIDAHIAIVCIDKPDAVELVYWGDSVNTEFVVEFQHEDGKFVLKSFGRFKDIPKDWEKQGEFKL